MVAALYRDLSYFYKMVSVCEIKFDDGQVLRLIGTTGILQNCSCICSSINDILSVSESCCVSDILFHIYCK